MGWGQWERFTSRCPGLQSRSGPEMFAPKPRKVYGGTRCPLFGVLLNSGATSGSVLNGILSQKLGIRKPEFRQFKPHVVRRLASFYRQDPIQDDGRLAWSLRRRACMGTDILAWLTPQLQWTNMLSSFLPGASTISNIIVTACLFLFEPVRARQRVSAPSSQRSSAETATGAAESSGVLPRSPCSLYLPVTMPNEVT